MTKVQKTDERRALARHISTEIINVMGAAGVSFEQLAMRLGRSIADTRSLVYGIEKEMTFGDLSEIVTVLECRVTFSLDAHAAITKYTNYLPKPSHLKLVEYHPSEPHKL